MLYEWATTFKNPQRTPPVHTLTTSNHRELEFSVHATTTAWIIGLESVATP